MSKTVSSRWYVEVFPEGATHFEARYCVEAERWKSALKKARAISGYTGSITGHVGERREGGFHVREPSGKVSYFIRKAPADAQLSTGKAEAPPPASAPASSPKQAVKASQGEGRQETKPKFHRLFRIFSSLRPPLRVSASSRHRSVPQQAEEINEPPSVADAEASTAPAPSSPWASSSPLAAAGRPGEYLIGKLFEQMHGLHFMPDLISGANFVADVLAERIPCAGLLIHVFDINRREFVVVRARGPRDDVLLHKSPDDHALFVSALRREMVLQTDPREYESFDTVRFNKLGLVVTELLCGPVHQGRRYLGVIELANPLTDRFSEAQVHALEYVCNQFAEFVASHPVVIDEEAVLAARPSAGAAG
jgi:hypothetical protein